MWISDLPIMLVLYLLLTIVVETSIAILIGIRNKKDILNVVLVNIVTNPLVNVIHIYFEFRYGMQARWISLILLELFAFLLEGWVYSRYLYNKRWNGFILSLILNGSSYLLGEIINWIIF